MNKKIRILLVDDHSGVREGLKALLLHYSTLEVVGEASDGSTAVQLARNLLPDVILMDVRMPGLSGVEATRLITKEHPSIRVIGFTTFAEGRLQAEMQDAGASVCLSKDCPIGVLIAAFRNCCP
jgi:DNA-binding NarL/FixJ family response regulator